MTDQPLMGAPVTPASLPPGSDPDRGQTITERAADLEDHIAVGAVTVGRLIRALAEAEARTDLLRAQVAALTPEPPGPVARPALPDNGPVWWGDVVPHPGPEDTTVDVVAARAVVQALAHHQAFLPAALGYLADTSPVSADALRMARARHLQTAHTAYTAVAALRGVPAADITSAIDDSSCWHHLADWAASYLTLAPDQVDALKERLTVDDTVPAAPTPTPAAEKLPGIVQDAAWVIHRETCPDEDCAGDCSTTARALDDAGLITDQTREERAAAARDIGAYEQARRLELALAETATALDSPGTRVRHVPALAARVRAARDRYADIIRGVAAAVRGEHDDTLERLEALPAEAAAIIQSGRNVADRFHAALGVARDGEHGARRWEHPDAVPAWVIAVRAALGRPEDRCHCPQCTTADERAARNRGTGR